MRLNPLSGSGTVLMERYRLEERLSGPDPLRGSFWSAVDVMAGDCPVALRQLNDLASQEPFRQRWEVLQTIGSHQLPRFGQLLDLEDGLWAVRDWIEGSSLASLQQQRARRQMVFSAGEVLLLLRQVLPVLGALHSHDLVHGHISLQNLWRRTSDGLPVVLKGELVPTEDAASWMDVRDLAVSAMALLTGQPSNLPSSLERLGLNPAYQAVLERLLTADPNRRFPDIASAQEALQQLAMPEHSGPIEKPIAASGRFTATAPSSTSPRQKRAMAREQGAEGRLWPVVIALALSALVSSAIGWFLLPRTSTGDRPPRPRRDGAATVVSLPPEELDQREQLFSRLRALQVDRSWFVELVDASQLSMESLESAPLRRHWTELAEQWLARIGQLSPAIRARLGRLSDGDWEQPRQALRQQGVHPKVVEHLVSAGTQDLLPMAMQGRKPADPFLQLWISAAMQSLDEVEIVRLKARPLEPTNTSLRIPAGDARLVLVEAPVGDAVALGINGTPLMQMMVFGVNGQVEAERGPLRVARIAPKAGLPLQVLVTNQGVSSGLFTLSCRAEPLPQ
ncbi:serine/threonine protein kinase [Parasynechococcus sp.]|uniref:serine/threonine protein kinase n=1 Tax=Parasynechococcus sp. TaxID=3101203 RepID=UPI003704BADF